MPLRSRYACFALHAAFKKGADFGRSTHLLCLGLVNSNQKNGVKTVLMDLKEQKHSCTSENSKTLLKVLILWLNSGVVLFFI